MSEVGALLAREYNVTAERCDFFLENGSFDSVIAALPALNQEQETVTQKVSKNGKELINVASVNIEIPEQISLSNNGRQLFKFIVDIEILPCENDNEATLVVSSDSVSLFQIGFKMENNSKIAVDKQLPLILDICAHKNQERALRNQLEDRKSLERKPSRKRRKKIQMLTILKNY